MNWSENLSLIEKLIPIELWNTIYMVFVSGFFATLFGIPLGILLFITTKGGLKERQPFYRLLSTIVNIVRSIPFAILIIAIFPITRWIVGTSLGTNASIVPLTIAAIPFMARLAEVAFKEVDKNLIDAAIAMGSTTGQIVQKVVIPESLPAIVHGLTLTLINLVGYSAMAGLVGGGGLGKVAIQYGYQRFNGTLMLATLIILLLLIEVIQWAGNRIAHKILEIRGKT